MAYEFTKKKIAAERSARIRRLLVAVIGYGVGFAIGAVVNDMHSAVGQVGALSMGGVGGFVLYRLTE